MIWEPIEVYQGEWNTTDHTGRVALKVAGAWNYVYPESPGEFSLLIDLLRNEDPVYLVKEKTRWRVVTGVEEVGEEET